MSAWLAMPIPPRLAAQHKAMGGAKIDVFRRNVSDGDLVAFVAMEPTGWHMSLSHARRHPTWEELRDARYDLLPDNVYMAQILPPRREYVNVHPHTFHLHEISADGEVVRG